MTFEELYHIAKAKIKPRSISRSSEAGTVAAAVLTESGNVYTGVSIDTPCSMGYCAEHNAIGTMITAGESKVVKMVAVTEGGLIVPPCGRCREFVYQVDDANGACEVLMPNDEIKTIAELLPYPWN